MRQSSVEIEDYSIRYFKCITSYEALYWLRTGLICDSPIQKSKVILSRISIASLPSKCHIAELPGGADMHFVDSLDILQSTYEPCP